MATLNLTENDIRELLVILNNALGEVNEQLSHEYVIPAARESAEARRETIRKWIHRLTQQGLSQQVGSEGTPRRGIDAADAEAQARQDWSNDE